MTKNFLKFLSHSEFQEFLKSLNPQEFVNPIHKKRKMHTCTKKMPKKLLELDFGILLLQTGFFTTFINKLDLRIF